MEPATPHNPDPILAEETPGRPRLAFLRRGFSGFRLSRLLRWAVFFFLAGWLYANWHQDVSMNTLVERYGFSDSRFIEVDGMRVHYRETGRGPTMLLLHDASNSLHTWNGWTDTLARHYRVISLDLPGFGLTGPHPHGSYSAFMYAGFLEKFSQALDLQRFHLVGNGLGAQIAWVFAAENPQRIDKLVLMDAPGFEPKSNSWIMLLARTPVLNRILWHCTPKSFVYLSLQEIYANDIQVTDSLVTRHFELFLRAGNRKAFTDRAKVHENRPPVELVAKIELPTLILWGAEDTQMSPEYAYEFHKRIRGSFLKIYQNTGHWPQEENPIQTVQDVQAFLAGNF